MNVRPDGQVDRLNVCLVANGYTQKYGSNYYDIFTLVAKIAFVRLLLYMIVMRSYTISHQFHIRLWSST